MRNRKRVNEVSSPLVDKGKNKGDEFIWADALSSILNELKSKTPENRTKAAEKLKNYVSTQAREMSAEDFSNFMNDLTHKHICAMVNSSAVNEKIGGIMAIDKLIDIEHDENAKTTRLANYLRLGLTSNDATVMQMASQALGRLAQASGTLTAVFVEFEVKRALEWAVDTRHESRRYAAVLVLKELAQNAPTLFYVHVASFFKLVWTPLRDHAVHIREGAVEALRAALALISKRENRLRLQWYHKIFEEAQKGFKSNTSDTIHGSLIALGELLRNTGEFMHTRFKEVCETVLKYKDHRDRLVKRTVITLLPRLAIFSPDDFVHNYLNVCMNHLLSVLKTRGVEERAASFIALGNISQAVGANIKPYLESLIEHVKEALKVKSKLHCIEALSCVSMISSSVGIAELQPHMYELLDLMFSSGLNEQLTQSLAELAVHIPNMLPNIQEKLMNHISQVLDGKPFIHPGNRAASLFRNSMSMATTPSTVQQYNDKDKGAAILLALKTLGSFNLQESLLTEFVREVVVGFLDNDDPAIRKEAALTCSSLLVRTNNKAAPTRGHLAVVIGEVLEKLLIVGIADPDPSIRKAVLSCLDERFDHHLAQAENLRSLFIALNDEVFEIRELAITTIGRLTIRNPAYVMPSLRKTLIQLLTELEFSGDSRNKEESARLLGHLIRSSERLIKPYVEPILNALLPKLKDSNPRVASCVLATLGELARVGGEAMAPYIDQLLPLIIDTLQDKSSVVKREVALRTLGQLAESTGYVIQPFLCYPQLLDIVLNEVKTEQAPSIRAEVVKVLGILGAIDPYQHKVNEMKMRKTLDDVTSNNSSANGMVETLSGMAPSSEDYYLTVSVKALMKILRDPSLSTNHTTVIQAVMLIFKSLGLKCIPFLPQIMPPFLQVMRAKETGFLKFLFKQLGVLVAIVKQHIRDYLDEIFVLIKEYWHTPLIDQIITLVEEISMALNDEFKVFLPELIPQMLNVLHTDRSPERGPTRNILHAFEVFGTNLDDYLHLIIPAVVKLFEQVDASIKVRKLAIQTLGRLCNKLNFSDYASRIIHPLARVLDSSHPELRTEAMQTLCYLVFQLGSDYAIFIPMINKVLVKHRISHPMYETLVSRLLKNQPLLLNGTEFENMRKSEPVNKNIVDSSLGLGSSNKLKMNEPKLKKAWEASQRSTKEDWADWIRRFSVELLQQSPSPALRSCLPTAQVFHPLARELFNAGFLSCWTELHEQYQDQLVHSLETALKAPSIPPEILQNLLNLAEFMEHDEKPLPIPIKTLGGLAEKCAAYAKALHYKEIEFQNSPATTCEALISINNQLDLPEAAVGILVYARQNHNIELKESWYEKLQRWDDAKAVYEKKQKQDQLNMELTSGRMRCHHALAEWEELHKLSVSKWNLADTSTKQKMAPLAAAAAWNLGEWDSMQEYVEVMPGDSVDGTFFRAVFNLHMDRYEEAQNFINKTRALLDTELRALVGESYKRAYKVVVKVQQLSEMEEIIDYKKNEDFADRRATIKEIWTKRLFGCQRNVEVWQDMLSVRKMVIPPNEDVDNWLKFASLCRKSGQIKLSKKTLSNLMKDPEVVSNHPQVTVAYFKHIWDEGHHHQAFERLRDFTKVIETDAELLSKCYLTLGQWQKELNDTLSSNIIPQILGSFKQATKYADSWYKAWHAWALSNFEVISHYQKQGRPRNIEAHLVPAVHGFFRSIALAPGKSLQDTLRLLTLWFKYGDRKMVEEALVEGFNTVSIDTWLQVIPQLIARIHSPVPSVARMIHDLLTDVGRERPQALVYPLSVASKSQSNVRVAAANSVLDKMREHSESLVDAALLVSRELIRVAILWHEMWHEGLEEASRLYFGNRDVEGMFKKLDPLHKMMNSGPETLREISFQQAYGRDLQEALEWCMKYLRSGKTSDLNQAWDLYYHVFRRINKQLPNMRSLELQYVSPKLLEAMDLELAVPGTYEADTDEVVKISSFAPTLSVISSKQRPRKLSMCGSDGKEYTFLLKGHEDLRQDERVMQLFGLINTLLANDRETANRHLSIQRYAIIPLSPNSGLIGWVPNHDTLHVLISQYRESRRIKLNIEHRLMLQMAANLEQMTLIQKVEVFEYALENTNGTDLDKVLWLKSPNSEVWLDRRTNYTRSLAVMSMVGYILGLGDRHPSNLMLDRFSGKITHIDFGDCFEVAMQRDKYPEKIPFRLTRMLINAMEVSGIEGNFRFTCENVMRVLRENKESVMAVLEAFVYDPLINWRLLTPKSPSDANTDTTQQETKIRRTGSTADDSSLGMVEETVPTSPEIFSQSHRAHAAGTYHSQSLSSRVALAELSALQSTEDGLNERALSVIDRVAAKLRGKDFSPKESLDVPQQVTRLIEQATSHENLCQCYVGWCPFW